MMSASVLDEAVAQSIITRDQAQALRALADARAPAPAARPQDDEALRFITGFGDIFATIGLALFLGAGAFFIDRQFGGRVTWSTLPVIAWVLAEIFTRRLRMAFPSIVLLLVFSSTAFVALSLWLGSFWSSARPSWFLPLPWYVPDLRGGANGLAALGTLALVALHYARFRVPITVAAGAGAAIAAVLAFAATLIPNLAATALNSLLLVCGIAVFAAAMGFDTGDPARATRRTDIAFWLHLLAAPLIVHPLVRGFLGVGGETLDLSRASAVLAIFPGLALVALAVDRRAILVSGLVYAGIAFGSIVQRSGLADLSFPATLLILGMLVLLLSGAWHPLRRAVLRLLPAPMAQRLPLPTVRP